MVEIEEDEELTSNQTSAETYRALMRKAIYYTNTNKSIIDYVDQISSEYCIEPQQKKVYIKKDKAALPNQYKTIINKYYENSQQIKQKKRKYKIS